MAKKNHKESKEQRAKEREIIDRDQALGSLNKKQILDYLKRYGLEIEQDSVLFWNWVHTTRLELGICSSIQEYASKRWLERYGKDVAQAKVAKLLKGFEKIEKERKAL